MGQMSNQKGKDRVHWELLYNHVRTAGAVLRAIIVAAK